MSAETGSLMGQTLIALLVVIGLILGLAYWVKRSPLAAKSTQVPMRLINALSLSTRERILIVEVGSQWLILGHSQGGLSRLGEMTAVERAHYLTPAETAKPAKAQAIDPNQAGPNTFSEFVQKALRAQKRQAKAQATAERGKHD